MFGGRHAKQIIRIDRSLAKEVKEMETKVEELETEIETILDTSDDSNSGTNLLQSSESEEKENTNTEENNESK
jgi:hypothetical protein